MTIGDLTRFPIALRAGREVLHFGTSTGVARLDTLSIGTPLTTEVFENRQTAVGIEFAFPTPPLAPPPPAHVIPPVQPQVIAPIVTRVAEWLGYVPLPQRPAQAAASLRFRLVAARIGGRDSARLWAAGPIARGFRPAPADPGAAERDALGARGPLG